MPMAHRDLRTRVSSPRPRRAFIAGAGALLQAVALAEPAHADGAARAVPAAATVERAREQEARKHTDHARQLYERGDFGGASASYRAAYTLRPSAGVLFNLAQAYRQDGQCREAASAYRAVLEGGLDGPAGELAARQLEATELCMRALDVVEERRGRRLRRQGIATMIGGGAVLVVAGALAVGDHDRRDGGIRPLTAGVGVGGGVVLAAGAVMFGVAQRRLHGNREARPAIFRVPVGTSRVAGLSVRF